MSVAIPSADVAGYVARPSSTNPFSDPTQSTSHTRTKVGKHVPFREHILRRQDHVGRETVSARTLPPRLGCPAARYFKQSTRRLSIVLAGEIAHDGCDVVGLGGVDE